MTVRYSRCAVAAALLAAGCASDPEVQQTAETGTTAEATDAATTMAQIEADAAEPTGEGLGLSRDGLVAVLAEHGLPADAFEMQTLPDGREVFATSYPETTARQVLAIAIFGEPAAPHTIRIDYFPTNALPEEAQTAGRALDGLASALFPDWQEATDWPEVAAARAWQETRNRGLGEGDEQQVPVLETQQNGAWLATLGVPGQIVSYVITTQEACRPSQADGFYEGYSACR